MPSTMRFGDIPVLSCSWATYIYIYKFQALLSIKSNLVCYSFQRCSKHSMHSTARDWHMSVSKSCRQRSTPEESGTRRAQLAWEAMPASCKSQSKDAMLEIHRNTCLISALSTKRWKHCEWNCSTVAFISVNATVQTSGSSCLLRPSKINVGMATRIMCMKMAPGRPKKK